MRLTTRLTTIRNADLFFVALGLMLVSIPLSRFVMSVSQFTLLGLWFWHLVDRSYLSNYPAASLIRPPVFFHFVIESLRRIYVSLVIKIKLFSHNKAALVLTSLYILHIAGLLNTSNFDYAVKDLRIKIPLLLLPLLLSTGPKPSLKIQRMLLLIFTAAVLAGTLVSAYILFTKVVADPRDISIFVSHIRFSLSICLSIFILGYYLTGRQIAKFRTKIIFAVLICWFLVFLVLMESGTGILITSLVLLSVLLYISLNGRHPATKLLAIGLIILLPLAGFIYVHNAAKKYSNIKPVDLQTLKQFSKSGTSYVHDTINFGVENGRYVGLYLAVPELRIAWNERSAYKYDSADKRGQEIQYTLIRFLSSKGYRKDAEGVKNLTPREVQYIEAGVANAEYIKKFSIKSLIYQIIPGYFNYRDNGNPNASSAMQRLEYWKTSVQIIKQNWLTGVGTGDLPDAFTKQYELMNSPLEQAYRWRSHNQYLSIFIAFGVFGFLWFLVTLIYPAIITKGFKNYIYVIFWLIVVFSMFTEDTLETQDGVTFYAFFNAFLLFSCDDSQNRE